MSADAARPTHEGGRNGNEAFRIDVADLNALTFQR
jgi:hypothetical protein